MLFIMFNSHYCIFIFITEVISDVDSDVNDINLHSVNIVNHVNKLENSSMKNLHVNCLDQLILVVHLPDVSVTTTNDFHCLL